MKDYSLNTFSDSSASLEIIENSSNVIQVSLSMDSFGIFSSYERYEAIFLKLLIRFGLVYLIALLVKRIIIQYLISKFRIFVHRRIEASSDEQIIN